MKKKMRLTYQNILATLLLSLLAFSSCRDEDLMDSVYLGDGRMMNVTIPISVSGRSVHTRSWISEENENKVQDFYLLAYRSDESSAYKLAAKRYFAQGEGMLEGNKLNMTLTTGTYILVGVANLKPGIIEQNVFEAIENLPLESDYSQLKNITVGLAVKGNLDRNTPALPMVGINDKVEISKDNQQVDPIHLKHLDAAIKFVFKTDLSEKVTIKENGTSVTHTQTLQNFKLKSWRVFRIPNKTALISGDSDEDICTDFSDDTTPRINFDVKDQEKEENVGEAKEESPKQDVSGSNEFSFYMLENKKTYKKKIGDNTKYSLRDKKDGKTDEKTDAQAGGTAEGSGTSVEWEYANDNSTYVKVEASIDILLTKENSDISHLRHADVTYYIHLGCTKPKGSNTTPDVDDYNTLRNGKYTYTVTVKGVNKIVIEATRENEEYQNGMEGTVVDFGSEGKRIELDSHYSVFNLEMTPQEIHDMGIEIRSPLTNYTYHANTNETIDENIPGTYDWQSIRFALHEGSLDDLVDYSKTYDVVSFENNLQTGMDPLITKPNNEHQTALYDFRTLKEHIEDEFFKDETSEENTKKTLTLTVFVNEYVYYDQPLSKYVNASDRTWRLISDQKISTDKNSTYIKAKYTVVQHAIQTYYQDNATSVIGWEHTNEHFGKKISMPTKIGRNDKLSNEDGLKNILFNILERDATDFTNYLGIAGKDNKLWTTWTSPITSLGTDRYTFQTKTVKDYRTTAGTAIISNAYYGDNLYVIDKNYGGKFWDNKDNNIYDAVAACLSRNRDLNRDGKINEDEIRWFLPTDEQYVAAAIGGRALVTPLVRKEEVSNPTDFPKTGGLQNISGAQYPFNLLPYHFVGSNNRKLYGEQLLSVGSVFDDWGKDPLFGKYLHVGWNFRCARYLNGPSEENFKAATTLSPPYRQEGQYVICDYARPALRNPEQGYLIYHGAFDEKNALCQKFQVAKKTIKLGKANLITHPEDLTKSAKDFLEKLKNNEFANEYYENSTSEKGTWRLPNLRELSVLNVLDILPKEGRYFCSTYWDLSPSSLNSSDPKNLYIYMRGGLEQNITRTTPMEVINDVNSGSEFYLLLVRDVVSGN